MKTSMRAVAFILILSGAAFFTASLWGAATAPVPATNSGKPVQGTNVLQAPAASTNSSLSNTAAGVKKPVKQEMSFIRKYFKMGGVFMYPLLILSIVAMAIVMERFWYFSRRKLNITQLAGEVVDRIKTTGATSALAYCDEKNTMGSRILGDGLRLHEAGIERVEKGMETSGGVEIGLLERGLSILAAVANLAPLLGFLGTVTGMIVAFKKIAGADTVSAKLVSVGIFEALVTTAVGLIVAIPAFAFHNVFVHKIDKFATEVEKASATVVNTMILEGKKGQIGEG